jgi:hypothetical protein
VTKHLLNSEVAILMRVNELGERYGLKPYDFGAEVWFDAEAGKTVLMFGWTPEHSTPNGKQFSKMVDSLGVGHTSGRLQGEDRDIIDAIDNALLHAPRRRMRG